MWQRYNYDTEWQNIIFISYLIKILVRKKIPIDDAALICTLMKKLQAIMFFIPWFFKWEFILSPKFFITLHIPGNVHSFINYGSYINFVILTASYKIHHDTMLWCIKSLLQPGKKFVSFAIQWYIMHFIIDKSCSL